VRDGRTRAALPSNRAGTETRNDNAGDDEEKHPVPAHFLSVEAMEDLVLEAYENLRSDGENMFVPPDVSSKLQLFARLLVRFPWTRRDGKPTFAVVGFAEGRRVRLRR
jgi:hypothetical protein